MLKYRLLLFIALSSNFIFFGQIKYENDSIIIWNKERKINWGDFKSANKINSYENAKAVIAWSVAIFPKKINCINIHNAVLIAKMNKKKSWVREGSDYLLTHEQIHFDIAELFARKIRKELDRMLYTDMNCNIEEFFMIYKNYTDDLKQYQILYDNETNHGLNVNAQLEWNDKIREMLDQYKDFEIDINIDDLDLE
jgi:hypothetical protein